MQPLYDIASIAEGRGRRASSWDRSGGNDQCVRIDPGTTQVLADIPGAGVVTRVYVTLIAPNPLDYRDAVLRMFWDGAKHPSVEAPLGDFFCIGHCMPRRFQSLMMAVNPGGGAAGVNNGLCCHFPMPFAAGARIEIENQGPRVLGGMVGRLWYHIDYRELDSLPPDMGRFHAFWRRENPTPAWEAPPLSKRQSFPRINLSDAHNYVILEARGRGHLAGLFLEIDNVSGGWYGEGADMIFIDDEPWPPSLHGTGTEEIFGGGACPDVEYAGPHSGFLLVENRDGLPFAGKNAMYRWYLNDRVQFERSIRMSIEHGHGNDLENDYASVAYWYQHALHAPLPALPPRAARRPRNPESYFRAADLYGRVSSGHVAMVQDPFIFDGAQVPPWNAEMRQAADRGGAELMGGNADAAVDSLKKAVAMLEENGFDTTPWRDPQCGDA